MFGGGRSEHWSKTLLIRASRVLFGFLGDGHIENLQVAAAIHKVSDISFFRDSRRCEGQCRACTVTEFCREAKWCTELSQALGVVIREAESTDQGHAPRAACAQHYSGLDFMKYSRSATGVLEVHRYSMSVSLD